MDEYLNCPMGGRYENILTHFRRVVVLKMRDSCKKREKSVETTQVYLHVMQKPGAGVRSPLDSL